MPICHTQAAIGKRGVLFVMGDNDEGGASFFAQLRHQLIKDSAVLAVKVTAWFVGKHQSWIIHQGAGNGDPLLFAA